MSHAPRVKLVDGQRIRDEIYTDFTMGGSDARYNFIPEGEIWVERQMTPLDREATILHETVERKLMLGGMLYGPAHDRATAVEARFRQRRSAQRRRKHRGRA